MTLCMYFIYYIYVANTVLSGVPIVSMMCYLRLFERSKITVFVILFGGLWIDILFSNGDKHSRLMQNIFY